MIAINIDYIKIKRKKKNHDSKGCWLIFIRIEIHLNWTDVAFVLAPSPNRKKKFNICLRRFLMCITIFFNWNPSRLVRCYVLFVVHWIAKPIALKLLLFFILYSFGLCFKVNERPKWIQLLNQPMFNICVITCYYLSRYFCVRRKKNRSKPKERERERKEHRSTSCPLCARWTTTNQKHAKNTEKK